MFSIFSKFSSSRDIFIFNLRSLLLSSLSDKSLTDEFIFSLPIVVFVFNVELNSDSINNE